MALTSTRDPKLNADAVRSEERLVPAAEAYERIIKAGTTKGGLTQATTPEGRRTRRIDGHLVTLMRITHSTWKGPALVGLMRFRGKALEIFRTELRLVPNPPPG